MKITYTKNTLQKLEQLFKDADYKLRYEKGQFKSGYCLLYQKKVIVINKFFDLKGRIESLLDIIHEVKLPYESLSPESQEVYVKILGPVAQQEKLVA